MLILIFPEVEIDKHRLYSSRVNELVSYTVALNEADMLFQEIRSTITTILNRKKVNLIDSYKQ